MSMHPEPRLFAPDQYVLAEDDAAAPFHELVSEWMREAFVGDASLWISKRVPAGGVPALAIACLDRLEHIRRNVAILPFPVAEAGKRLYPLLDALAAERSLPEPAVCRLIALDHALTLDHSFDLAKRHAAEHGMSPALVQALKALAKRSSHFTGAQHFRKQVDAYLLKAAPPASRPKRGSCWGDFVRWSVVGGAAAWEPFLGIVNVHNVNEPSKKWIGQATPILRAISAAEFESRLGEWFGALENPKDPGGPYGLTTPGSFLLRTLIWCFAVQPPSAGLARLAVNAIANGNWKKTKPLESPLGPLAKAAAAASYVVSLGPPEDAIELLHILDDRFGYPEGKVRERYLAAAAAVGAKVQPKERANPYAQLLDGIKTGLLVNYAKAALSTALHHPRIERCADGQLRVQGDLDSYRIEADGRSVTRSSDGANLRVEDTQGGLPVEQLAMYILTAESDFFLRFEK